MITTEVKTYLFAAGITCSVFAIINFFRPSKRILGGAFLALGITCVTYGTTFSQMSLYVGGGIVIAFLILDIILRSGPKK